MAYQEHAPAAALAGVIDRVWVRRCSAAGREAQRVLPDGCVDVLFHLGARPSVVAVGAMTRPRLVPAGPADIVAVRFRPGGAARFFGAPIDALTDLHVPLADLAIEARPTIDALLASPAIAARREAIERLVAARVRVGAPVDRRVARAISALVSPRPPAIETLARELELSRQYLARRVRATVGVGPKQLARVARVQRVLVDLTRGRRDFAALAIDHGLFDQAHLIHEVRAVTGLTPGELTASVSISPISSAYELP